MEKRTLLVIIPDRLSELIHKGEITARYYNPGELFDEVHILMTNDDNIVNPEDIKKTVGHAKLYFHNLPRPSFFKTLCWRPWLLRKWAGQGVRLAKEIRPNLIRCYGNYVNGYVGAEISHSLKVPMALSLHSSGRETGKIGLWSIKQLIAFEALKSVGKHSIKNASIVMPVYEHLREYALKNGARRVEVVYNIINPLFIGCKKFYTLHNPPQIISVGRQFREKNPENIIRAVARIDAHLTVVGDGPYHSYLKQVAKKYKVEDRVKFIRALPNDELCQMLPDYDIFATHSERLGVPKAVLEPLLTGLPVVVNKRKGPPVPEFQGDWIMLVDNTPGGYSEAFRKLLDDDAFREQLGRRAYEHAHEYWAPEKMEKRVVDLYLELMEKKR